MKKTVIFLVFLAFNLLVGAQPMQGVYTVGTTSGNNYSSLDVAVADLYNLGVAGDVEFWLDGQQFSTPLSFNGNLTNPNNASITFKTHPAATQLAALVNSAIPVHLISIENIVLDSLYIETTGQGSAIRIEGYTEAITIRNCVVKGKTNAGGHWSEATILKRRGGYNTTNDFTVQGNTIRYGSYGIYAGGTPITDQNRLWLEGNNIDSVGHMGIFAEGWDTASFLNNEIQNQSIYGGLGIQLDEVHNFTVAKNSLKRCGMDFHWCNTLPGQLGEVANNFIANVDVYQAKAIAVDVSHNLLIAHNTIKVECQDTAWARPIHIYNADSIQLVNNIFHNSSTGRMVSSNLNHEPLMSDGNNYYSPVSAPSFHFPAGTYNGLVNYTNNTGRDSNSFDVDPLFANSYSYIPNAVAIANQGVSGTGIIDDIAGQLRGASPDIGCLEFAPPTDYLVLAWEDTTVCRGNDSLLLKVINAGSNTVNTAVVQLVWDSLAGSSSTSQVSISTLQPGSFSTVTVPAFLALGDTIQLQATPILVNGVNPSIADSIVISSLFGRGPQFSVPAYPHLCTNDSSLHLTGISPAGGTFYGNGVQDSLFSPFTVGSGVHAVTYFAQDLYGCFDSTTFSVTVNDTLELTQMGGLEVCEEDAAVALHLFQPAGGNYSGAGVSNGEFIPSLVSAGFYRVDYEITAATGCQSTSWADVEVKANPTLTKSAVDSVCQNDALLALSIFTPSGGVYSGVGVNAAGLLNPAILPAGVTTVNYYFEGTNGCSVTDSAEVVILEKPEIFLGEDTLICAGDSVEFQVGNDFTNVLWSTGETSHIVLFSSENEYSVSAEWQNGCWASDSIFISVDQCLGVESVQANVALQVYPNPTSDVVQVQLLDTEELLTAIRVVDLNGKTVRTVKVINNTALLRLGDLLQGVYIIRAESGQRHWIRTIVVN